MKLQIQLGKLLRRAGLPYWYVVEEGRVSGGIKRRILRHLFVALSAPLRALALPARRAPLLDSEDAMKPTSLLAAITLTVFTFGALGAQTCRDDIAATAPDSRFRDNGDGTVTDLAAGLIWKQCAEGLSGAGCATGSASSFTWQQALQHAADNPPWRLPNTKELVSLVESRCATPAINSRLFPNTPPARFWSSSAPAISPSSAWSVFFDLNTVDYVPKYYQSYVRLVRGGSRSEDSQPPSPGNVQASDGTEYNVIVTWDSVPSASSYEIWRSSNDSTIDVTRIADGIAGSRYEDTTAPYAAYSYFWVTACNSAGCSDFGNYDTGYPALRPQ